jgi:hypothetical protein
MYRFDVMMSLLRCAVLCGLTIAREIDCPRFDMRMFLLRCVVLCGLIVARETDYCC